MKNAILAILGVFAFSSAFACSGCAPPPTVKTELSFKAVDLHCDYDYVMIKNVNTEARVFSVTKPIVSTSVALAVPSIRLGFVYRNVVYESSGNYLCAKVLKNPKILVLPDDPNLRDNPLLPDRKCNGYVVQHIRSCLV